MMPAIEKAFDLMCDDIVELSRGNDASKKKLGDCDEYWLKGSKANLLKQIDNGKKANLLKSRVKNR